MSLTSTYLVGLREPCGRALLLQLPVAVAVVTPAAVVLAAARWCLRFLGHDVGCNVLHLLSLLVQGKLLREGLARRPEGESQLDADRCAKRPRQQVGSQHVLGGHLCAPVLGFALTFGRACSRSAVLKRVWHCSRLIAAFLCRDSA